MMAVYMIRERRWGRRDRIKKKDLEMIRLKKGFRRFAAAALCVVLALSAAGCGGGGSKKESGSTGSASSSMPEITSKDGVVTSKMVSLGEDFATDGLQILGVEDGVFYGFNYSYEGDGLSAYELVQFKEDGSGFKKVTFNLENQEVSEITASTFKNGSYYLAVSTTGNSPALDYALENNLDTSEDLPEGVELSEDAVSTYQIACVGTDGKQKWIKDVREPADSMYFYIESLVGSDNGVYVVSPEGVDLYSAEDGSFKETICSVTPEQLTGILHVREDGTVVMVDDTGSTTRILSYDNGKKEFVDSISLPGSLMGASVFTGSQYDLYLASEEGIYGAKLGSDQLDVVANYVNSDLAVEGISTLTEIEDGRLAIQAYGAEITLDTYVLEKVAPEDVKDRKEITLGGYYISYDVRNEVIKFNKENSEYRIAIRDYSQYDLAEDEYNDSTGLSTMNTDIVSGNVPDILVMNESMPVSNYISKGLMIDMTERYEADKEIDKSDFLQNVIDAFKSDGRMYVIVPGFTVTGIAGKSKYIGDGKDLTIQKAKKIASDLGLDETGVFGIIDRESVLSYAIEFSGDQFIDMDQHTCDFNNPQFQELLEFANKFPAQIGDEQEYDFSTQFLADKALLGIQFINTPYDYYYMTRQMYGDVNMTITGFPSQNNKGPAVAPSVELGISSSASDPDGCWSFVRRFLLPEYQKKLDSCLPISRSAIKKQGEDVIQSFKEQELSSEEFLREQDALISEEETEEESSIGLTGDEIVEVTDDMEIEETEESEDLVGKPVPEEDFDGTHEEYEQYLEEFKKDAEAAEDEEEVIIEEPMEEESTDTYGLDSLPEFGQNDLNAMQKILENLSFSVNSENEVLNIIMEEAGAYFAGQKSTSEVSDIIQSRISVYLKENE